MKGIEPSYQAWEARVLPLNYTRGGEGWLLAGTGRNAKGDFQTAGQIYFPDWRRPSGYGFTVGRDSVLVAGVIFRMDRGSSGIRSAALFGPGEAGAAAGFVGIGVGVGIGFGVRIGGRI